MSECVGCGRAVDADPVGPSSVLCGACQTRLGCGDPEIAAALAPEVTKEHLDDSFLIQDAEPSELERVLRPPPLTRA